MRAALAVAAGALGVMVLAGSSLAAPPAPPIGEKPQQVLYLAINVRDFDRSHDFYTRVIGLKEVARRTDGGAGGGAAPLSAFYSFSGTLSETFISLRYDPARQATSVRGDALARLAFKVTDLGGVLDRARAGGFQVLRDPAPVRNQPQSLQAFIEDPDGNTIEIVQVGGG